jgi:hypothetical protein
VLGVLGEALDRGSGVPRSILHNGDAFGPSARNAVADELAGAGIGALLKHCASDDKPVPATE